MKDPAQEHIRSIEYHSDIAIIRLQGKITFETLKATQEEFALKTKGKSIKNILFDLKNVPGSDTSGIAALIDLFKYMKTHQAGDKIGLINVPLIIKNLLAISKTQPLFNEYSSEEKAIENLK